MIPQLCRGTCKSNCCNFVWEIRRASASLLQSNQLIQRKTYWNISQKLIIWNQSNAFYTLIISFSFTDEIMRKIACIYPWLNRDIYIYLNTSSDRRLYFYICLGIYLRARHNWCTPNVIWGCVNKTLNILSKLKGSAIINSSF